MSSEIQPEPFSVVRGEGFPIVFAHGMGIDHRSMMMLDDAFPDGTKRIYIDLPGFGKTQALPEPGGLQDLSDWLRGTVAALVGEHDYALVGNSMGGALVRDLLGVRPEHLAGMALIAPVVDPVRAHRKVAEHTVNNPNEALTETLPESQSFDFLQMGVNQSFEAWRRYQRFILPGTRLCDREATMRLNASYRLDANPEERIGVFAGPVAIICGRQDQIVGYEDQRDLLPHYPNAVYTVVDDAGHNVHIDQPDIVRAALLNWAGLLPV
ncbi:MAG: alpha/beta hydrolase [Bifidobacterium tibiigranuli]|jgi:pimeloyl-ACP methyl ester carboxylesterase|uniref:alpha/beta fold hydrolase n=1 Tax=Bifidobacterium tibiigranuli TaxID=2172043 RepID=UPI0026F1AB3E|nr:alpha/beta hydrolase [Bifidobacterium tibiigranuli]MCI1673490.1 alpha/beta hydrolase [Bifidobacterium tibiigranuli]MCI1712790.1 alpha/beta hydrolase [Bifidobacterium tibiigranuli]